LGGSGWASFTVWSPDSDRDARRQAEPAAFLPGVTKTWFITGASQGFGREWAEAALERGDKVAATARKRETLDALADTYGGAVLPIQLDVTDRRADFHAVERAADHFGRLDVVINNAGYGHFGMIEELTEEEVRSQLETNLFGALWVTQAALPIMRAQGSGHIIQVSSLGGITAFPAIGVHRGATLEVDDPATTDPAALGTQSGTQGAVPIPLRPMGRILLCHAACAERERRDSKSRLPA
jgi:short chain dehydrogenase